MPTTKPEIAFYSLKTNIKMCNAYRLLQEFVVVSDRGWQIFARPFTKTMQAVFDLF